MFYSHFHFKCTSPSSSLFLNFVWQISEDTDSTLILNYIKGWGWGDSVDTNIVVCSSSWHNPEPCSSSPPGPSSPLRAIPGVALTPACHQRVSDSPAFWQQDSLPSRGLARAGWHQRSLQVAWHREKYTIKLSQLGSGTRLFRPSLARKWKDWARRPLRFFSVSKFRLHDSKSTLENFSEVEETPQLKHSFSRQTSSPWAIAEPPTPTMPQNTGDGSVTLPTLCSEFFYNRPTCISVIAQ